MDFSTFFTITFVAILSSGIGYSFWAIYQIRKFQSEIHRLSKEIRKDFKNKNV
jgi:hypothetical protein